MSEIIEKAKMSAVAWRIAVAWFVLFSLGSLGSCILAALTGTKWADLDGQDKFLIVVAIFVNWSGVIGAFLSKAAQKAKVPVIGETGPLGPENG